MSGIRKGFLNGQTQFALEQTVRLLDGVLKRTNKLDDSSRRRLEQCRGEICALLEERAPRLPFHAWLQRQQERRDAVGALARLAASDPRWPKNGEEILAACVRRIRSVNLARGAPGWKGMCAEDMIEHILYPAWEEYTAAAPAQPVRKRRPGRA